jgi:hypothetical protein
MHQVVPVAELVKVKPALFSHSWQMTHIPMASLINGSGLHPHGFNASHANSHAILHKTRTRLPPTIPDNA